MMNLFRNKIIYLDNFASTPIDKRVIKAMLPFIMGKWGNPHGKINPSSTEAMNAIDKSRKKVAKLIDADPKEIYFTSGATEANNLAIKGLYKFYGKKRNHIITSQIEHKSVLGPLRSLENDGAKITFLPVDNNGLISLKKLKNAINDKTLLVSIMAVNNEIGSIQKLKEIGKICKNKNVFFHTDAAQACGKIPISVKKNNINLLTFSGHKMYGPKGIGGLYISRKPKIRIIPLMDGGGQERNLRPGTLPTFLIVGLGKACEIARNELEKNHKNIKKLSKYFVNSLIKQIPEIKFNSSKVSSWPGCINVSFKYVEGESILQSMKNFALSTGSACSSDSLEPSYVLKSINLDQDLAHSSVRFSIGKDNKMSEIKECLKKLKETIENLRNLSPLWEFYKSGKDIKNINWKNDKDIKDLINDKVSKNRK